MFPSIGHLEETLLLIVLVMRDEVYGVTVAEHYKEHTQKSISIPAVHTVLKRLEKKGFLKSKLGGATTERGGRKKRLYEITSDGYRLLHEIRANREQLWARAPRLSF